MTSANNVPRQAKRPARRTHARLLAAALLAACLAAALAPSEAPAPAAASESDGGLLGRLVALAESSAASGATDESSSDDASANGRGAGAAGDADEPETSASEAATSEPSGEGAQASGQPAATESGLDLAKRVLRETILAGETGRVSLEGYGVDVTREDFDAALDEVCRDPRCIHVMHDSYTYTERGGAEVVVSFQLEYRVDGQQLAVYQEQLNQVLDNLVATVDPAASDYDKCLYIYRWLIENVAYDSEVADSGVRQSVSRTPLGALAYGKAVCSGYASAYMLALQELGIECQYVRSEDMDHAWAAVRLDGAWHFADPTWDDHDDGQGARYFYFMVGADTLGRDHYGWDPQIAGTTDLYRPGVARFSPSEYTLADAVLSVVNNAWPDAFDILDYQVTGDELKALIDSLGEAGYFSGRGRLSFVWVMNKAGYVTEFSVRFL